MTYRWRASLWACLDSLLETDSALPASSLRGRAGARRQGEAPDGRAEDLGVLSLLAETTADFGVLRLFSEMLADFGVFGSLDEMSAEFGVFGLLDRINASFGVLSLDDLLIAPCQQNGGHYVIVISANHGLQCGNF